MDIGIGIYKAKVRMNSKYKIVRSPFMAQYMYNINYQDYELELCALEMRSLFNRVIESKAFFSDKKIDGSISPFIKNRLEVLQVANTLVELIQRIDENKYSAGSYKVQYVLVGKSDPADKDRKKITKAVGYAIEGLLSFNDPEIIYGVTCYEGKWYFGLLVYNTMLWKKHRSKPHSYSSSLGINTAKAILNIAAGGDLTKKIIDPCCGIGTVLLEGHYSGYDITGSEINYKLVIKARDNLKHYGYGGQVNKKDIKDINETYDLAIVDLPYGNFCKTDEPHMLDIIHHTARISKGQVFISSIELT